MYLIDFLVQNPGAEHGDALGADDRAVASGQRPGQLLLTVDDDGDAFLLHADGHAVPSGFRRRIVSSNSQKIVDDITFCTWDQKNNGNGNRSNKQSRWEEKGARSCHSAQKRHSSPNVFKYFSFESL